MNDFGFGGGSSLDLDSVCLVVLVVFCVASLPLEVDSTGTSGGQTWLIWVHRSSMVIRWSHSGQQCGCDGEGLLLPRRPLRGGRKHGISELGQQLTQFGFRVWTWFPVRYRGFDLEQLGFWTEARRSSWFGSMSGQL